MEPTMAEILSQVVARLPEELLKRAGLEHEPVAMLESADGGALVRKLTPIEKNEYPERTGESAFFATARELDEALLALPHDDRAAAAGAVIGEDQSSMSERRKRIPPVAACTSPPANSPAAGDAPG